MRRRREQDIPTDCIDYKNDVETAIMRFYDCDLEDLNKPLTNQRRT